MTGGGRVSSWAGSVPAEDMLGQRTELVWGLRVKGALCGTLTTFYTFEANGKHELQGNLELQLKLLTDSYRPSQRGAQQPGAHTPGSPPSPHGMLSDRPGGARPLRKGTEPAQTTLPWEETWRGRITASPLEPSAQGPCGPCGF